MYAVTFVLSEASGTTTRYTVVPLYVPCCAARIVAVLPVPF